MKNVVKNSFYATIGLILIWFNNVNAIAVWTVNEDIRVSWTADTVIQNWVANLLLFLYLAAVLLAIYGGFNILTAAWDEEKVKKWKTILIQAMLWVVIIFLAGSLVQWLLEAVVNKT